MSPPLAVDLGVVFPERGGEVSSSTGSPIFHWGVKPIDLIREGYAMASFSVRGTGESEGCIDLFGEDDQRDQAFLVEWLAGQPWSNGRVAMGGIAQPGTTPLAAAIQETPSLKTIVISGILSDFYTVVHTPQGAKMTLGHNPGAFSANHLVAPRGGAEHAPDLVAWLARYLHVLPRQGVRGRRRAPRHRRVFHRRSRRVLLFRAPADRPLRRGDGGAAGPGFPRRFPRQARSLSGQSRGTRSTRHRSISSSANGWVPTFPTATTTRWSRIGSRSTRRGSTTSGGRF